jgi:hypothetical protein
MQVTRLPKLAAKKRPWTGVWAMGDGLLPLGPSTGRPIVGIARLHNVHGHCPQARPWAMSQSTYIYVIKGE